MEIKSAEELAQKLAQEEIVARIHELNDIIDKQLEKLKKYNDSKEDYIKETQTELETVAYKILGKIPSENTLNDDEDVVVLKGLDLYNARQIARLYLSGARNSQ